MNKSLLVFLKYVCASLIIAAIDYTLFWIFQYITDVTLVRVLAARSIAVLAQFLLVKFKVFNSKLPTSRTLPFFIGLVVVNGIIVSLLINSIYLLGIPKFYAKIIAEVLLYLPNYWVLKAWIFSDSKNNTQK